MKKLIILLICACLLFCFFSCKTDNVTSEESSSEEVSTSSTSEETSESGQVIPSPLTKKDLVGEQRKEFIEKTFGFTLEIFKRTVKKGDSSMVSPLSVMLALAMTANGAKGETLSQMEDLLCKGVGINDLNDYLYTFCNELYTGSGAMLNIADSIWYKNGITVNDSFKKTVSDYYAAEIFSEPFDDSTAGKINDWVSEKTDGMIEKLVDEIDPNVVMCLINTILFDAEWYEKYKDDDIQKGTFYSYDGNENNRVNFMHSEESKYISDEKAQGFIKNYKNGYSFAALLPNEGVDVYDYVSGLTSEKLMNTLKNVEYSGVKAVIPEFESEFSLKMNDILIDMGMTDAFSGKADFSGMIENHDVCISSVIHKTKIEVTRKGTRAAAVTEVEVKETAMQNEHFVTLDRPFVYMIIDNDSMLPVFIGVTANIK